MTKIDIQQELENAMMFDVEMVIADSAAAQTPDWITVTLTDNDNGSSVSLRSLPGESAGNMEIFKDKTVEWILDYCLETVDRVKAAEGIDLLDLSENSPLWSMDSDYRLAAKILFRMCEEQAEGQRLCTRFMKGLNGDSIDEGVAALRRAAMDFFKGEASDSGVDESELEILRQKADQVVEKGLNIPDFEASGSSGEHGGRGFLGKIDSQFPIESET